jgi:uncharacterized protein (TIGR00255 family)
MKSMTGFGRAEIRRKDYSLQIELSAVNSRYLECIFRMPRILAGVESKIKETIGKDLSRGKLTITVNLDESPHKTGAAAIDLEMAEAYYRQLKRLKKKLRLPGEVDLSQLVAQPELLVNPSRGLDEERLWPDLKKLLKAALTDLKKMRADEGRFLRRDMKKRLQGIKKLITAIEKQSPRNIAAYRKRLQKRIKDMGNGIELDPQRLAEEVTVYADRSDVSEECTRLKSHLALYNETLENSGDSGKRLNFILQEMGRESNTIGSKAVDSKTSALAIELKEEIEKLREQAQNIE